MGLKFSPGFYAKVRLDDSGNIVDVGELEEQDLPQHSHQVSDISDLQNSLENKISEILSTFFANNGNSAVKFVYDKNTRTVTADVDIDEETIVKNEYGQLVSNSYSDADSFPSEESTSNLDQKLQSLENKIPDILRNILAKTFVSTESTAIDFIWDKNTGTVSADVNIDGISISRDENGDLIATGAFTGAGETGNCASHTHISDQIEDFQEAVLKIFNDYSKSIAIDFNNYIDGVTIKINEYGQLVAVHTAMEKHTHYLADILDYEAVEAAAKQAMSALGEDVDLSDGVIDFTNLNIGYSILALNKYLQDVVNRSIFNLTQKVNSLSMEKDNNGQAILSISQDAIKNNLYDRVTNKVKEVYLAKSVNLVLDYLPYKTGKIRLIKDGQIIETQNIEAIKSSGRFFVANSYSKNSFIAKILKIDVSDLLSYVDTFQVQFETEDGIDSTNTIEIYSTQIEQLEYVFEDTTAKHSILNKDYYDYPKQCNYKLSIKNLSKCRFINLSAGFDPVTGELTGVSDQSKELSIPGLFGIDTVKLDFPLEEEISDNPLLEVLHMENGSVCNDTLITLEEDSLEPYTATFDIPGSEAFNALKLVVTDPNFDIKYAALLKGENTAYGTIEASQIQSGFVRLSNSSYILTLGNSYDSGKYPMQLQLNTFKKISLDKLQFSPIDFC